MKKRIFLIFFTIVGLLVAGTIWFIQSPGFASLLKGRIAGLLPSDLGIEADFREIGVKVFPPGVSLKRPSIALKEHNVLKMPAGSTVRAERIDLNFQPFQMLSGDIRVHEVAIIDGEATIILAPPVAAKKQKKPFSLEFHWDELLQVRAEAVSVQNTKLHIVMKDTQDSVDFVARSLKLGQWSSGAGMGYEASIELGEIHGSLLKEVPLIRSVDDVRVVAHLNKTGLQIDEMSARLEGLQFDVKGGVKGDLLNPKDPKLLDSTVSFAGDLQKAAVLLFPEAKSRPDMEGTASFQGRVRANLLRFMETLAAEGKVSVARPRFQKWSADELSAVGKVLVSEAGTELVISKAVIQAEERERSAPEQPAHGGKVEVNGFRYTFGQTAPVTVPLLLHRAHVHWLAASELKSVFPLLLRASGPVEATFTPPRGKQRWQLAAKVDLGIADFQLDNQRLGQVKPLRRILKFPNLTLAGGVTIDPTGLYPNGLTLALPRSKFRVEGKIDFKTGYDLHGYGPQVRLEDVGFISENTIRGDGRLDIHVHGPGSKVFLDFDTDLKNAFYLNMNYGDLKGRITWDDDPDHLILSKLQALKGGTAYTADGLVDLGAAQSIAINVKVTDGNIHDLTGIFDVFTKDFWWFPRSLNGQVEGDIQIFGGVTMDKLEVLAKLGGKNWEFFGERFDRVALTCGYDKGRYHINDLKASKHGGRINGRISYDQTERLEWDLHTQQFTVSDLDHIAQLDVPFRGKFFVDSVGGGKIGAIRSNSQVLISDVAVRGLPMPSSQLFLKSENGRLEAKGAALGGQGTLDTLYDFKQGGNSYIRADLSRLDFTPILLLLNPRAIPDPAVAGSVSGAVNLTFQSGSIDRASGSIELSDYLLSKTGTRFRLARPVAFKVTDGSFDLKDFLIAGNRGEMKVQVKGRSAQLDGTVTGSLDANLAEFFTSSVSQANGVALLDFVLSGTIKEPALLGNGNFDGVSLRVSGVESPFENVTGSFQIRQNVVHVQDLEGDLAGGRVRAGGSITLYADRFPTLALKGNLDGSKIKVFPFQYAKVHGTVGVHGSELPYSVDGNIVVDSALCKENVLQQRQGQGLKVAQYTPPPSLRRLSDYPRFKLGIDVRSDGGILVQNDLFDVELKAQVKVVNTLDAPRLLGNVDLVQGKLVFKDRKFQIQSATGTFDSPTAFNPRFNLIANTEVSGIKVQLYASGRVPDKLKVELSSNPVMAEPEIISLLALGMTTQESKKIGGADRTVLEQGEAASLILHSLDFNREVESKTGIQIQLDESVNSQQGTSIFRPQTSTEAAAAPKIVFKKQINSNIDVSYGSTVGVGTASQKQINAEIKVTPGFSILGVYDTYESAEAKDKQAAQSYGLDFKVQKRFK